MKNIEAAALGATLFVPASHPGLITIACGTKYPRLRSMVIDFEDGLDSEAYADAVETLQALLNQPLPAKPYIFVRPRGPGSLKTIMKLKGSQLIDGVILPKCSLGTLEMYLNTLRHCDTLFMPSIEGATLCDKTELCALRTKLLPYRRRIILMRFGAEDLFAALGLRRLRERSLYDYIAPAALIGEFIALFKSAGFAIAAPVYPFFDDPDAFAKEAARDLEEGMISKTIIHPSQIDPIEALYRVNRAQHHEACKILDSTTAVSGEHGAMLEKSTMSPWARQILLRSELYGIA